MNPTSQLVELGAEWRNARALYPLYCALAREFVIDLPPCSDLESNVEAPPQESIEQARQWFAEVDERIHVHQLRQFLQTTGLISEEALRNLLAHHLHKEKPTDGDRDKIDFLLVQYFSHCAPSGLQDADVDLAYLAQVFEPVLGTVELTLPDGLDFVNQLIAEANACKNLDELFTSQILEKGRKLKLSLGENYFAPAAMLAFARFSFLMRRIFFRLMHQDLNGILDGLRKLEERGVTTLDCRKAQFSADEPISRLRMICQSWKVMFQAEYSSGQPLRMLTDLRAVIDNALARSEKGASKNSGPRRQAAAAGANGGEEGSDSFAGSGEDPAADSSQS